jgi:hypothetical protein
MDGNIALLFLHLMPMALSDFITLELVNGVGILNG